MLYKSIYDVKPMRSGDAQDLFLEVLGTVPRQAVSHLTGDNGISRDEPETGAAHIIRLRI